MGSVAPPTTGLVYVDANVVIDTNDFGCRNIPSLNVIFLDDVLAASATS